MSAATAVSSIKSYGHPLLDQTTAAVSPAMLPVANKAVAMSHRFCAHTYTVPTFCHQCHELMQEPSGHGLQCQGCRCNVHANCAAKLVSEVCLANQGTAREVHSYDEVNEDELSALEQEAARSETRGSVSGTNSVGSGGRVDSGSQWYPSKRSQPSDGQISTATAMCGCGARLLANQRCPNCQTTAQSKHSGSKKPANQHQQATNHIASPADAISTSPLLATPAGQQANPIGLNSVHAYSNLPNSASFDQSSEATNTPQLSSLMVSTNADSGTIANHMRAQHPDKQAHLMSSRKETLSQWPAGDGARRPTLGSSLGTTLQQPMVSPMSRTNFQSASVYANSKLIRVPLCHTGSSLDESDDDESLVFDSGVQPLDVANSIQGTEREIQTGKVRDMHTKREPMGAPPKAASLRGFISLHAKVATTAHHFPWGENGAGQQPYWPGVDQFSAWAMAAKINNSGIAFDDLRAMAVLGLHAVDLTKAPFFHPMANSLTQAERRAHLEACFQDKPDGTWLLRKSNGTFVLSVKYNFRVRHVLVEGHDGRFFVIPGEYFKTVLQLLAHYVHGHLSTSVPVQLRFPLLRHASFP